MDIPLSLLTKFIIDKVINFFKSADFKTPNAPRDIFKYIKPGVSPAFIKDRIKSPNYENENTHIYKFGNLFLELVFADNKVETVNAVLPDLVFKRFKVYPLKFTFGKIRFKDVYENTSLIQKDGSSKFSALWLENYYGNPGNYNYFCFGVYNGPGVKYGKEYYKYYSSKVELPEKQKKLKLNFMSISANVGKGSPIFFEYLR